ncbi:MAG: T9SS type A sorting domain-containing protein [Hymenobacteraceae bacterium]|nr:T9SS type A sorting domain-containing protein [Hymenobacteraceae bacterium]
MKKLALILSLLCSGITVMGQVVLQPLQQEPRISQHTAVAPRLAAAPVSLPFFDDFATTTVAPDPTRWINGGVYINNEYAVAPVTKNVATFDGLNALGVPYAPGSVGAGPSDTLTSQPILLGSLSPADSVYLSFYWQSGGLGDIPDKTSSNLVYLLLEFKDNGGSWQEVWRQPGIGDTTGFAQVFVGLKEPRFLHNDFQFRFRSVGQRNGLADVWNVDYIELDRNRRKGVNITRDIAISKGVSRLLRHYTAMPVKQFLENPAGELAEEVRATVNNLGGLPGAISWRGYIRRLNETAADTFLRSQGLIPGGARQFVVAGTPSIASFNLPTEPFTLLHGIRLDTREPNPLQRANDSTERKTEFANYYAYDDGTAEAGFSYVGTGSTQVAQRFDLNKPDQVEAFRIYFPRVRTNLSGTTITFRIWKDNQGEPGETLYQQNFQIQYSDTVNQFYEVALSQPVPVQGSFYIGWSQPGNLFVNVGFDRNEEQTEGRRFLFSSINGWVEDTIRGALMMRPVLIGEQALGLEEDLLAASIKVYPNPAAGNVYIEGEYELVTIYDVTGRQVYRQEFVPNEWPLDLKKLAPGLYTLRIQNRKAIITKKLILTKL